MSRRFKGALFLGVLLFSLLVGFMMLVVLIVDVFRDGLPYLDLTLLTNPPSSDPAIAGARPAILATLYIGLLLLLFVVPIGVGTALYLEEYADKTRWYNRLLEINIQNLAAVPSIVYGILGLGVPRARPRTRSRPARRGDDPDAARPADGDHRRARGDQIGA